jgi:hypothetical protein
MGEKANAAIGRGVRDLARAGATEAKAGAGNGAPWSRLRPPRAGCSVVSAMASALDRDFAGAVRAATTDDLDRSRAFVTTRNQEDSRWAPGVHFARGLPGCTGTH